MLKIVYGKMEGIIRRPGMYFDNTYDPEWLNDEMVREMIEDVDKSVVKGPRLIVHFLDRYLQKSFQVV